MGISHMNRDGSRLALHSRGDARLTVACGLHHAVRIHGGDLRVGGDPLRDARPIFLVLAHGAFHQQLLPRFGAGEVHTRRQHG